jgi:hypothetical protein
MQFTRSTSEEHAGTSRSFLGRDRFGKHHRGDVGKHVLHRDPVRHQRPLLSDRAQDRAQQRFPRRLHPVPGDMLAQQGRAGGTIELEAVLVRVVAITARTASPADDPPAISSCTVRSRVTSAVL